MHVHVHVHYMCICMCMCTYAVHMRIQVLDAAGKPLQVLESGQGNSWRPQRFGGICFAQRTPTDASADAHRLVVTSRSSHQVFIFRRQRRLASGAG